MSDGSGFDGLSEYLLRSGVSPRRVQRIGKELADHFRALVEEEIECGVAEQTARERANSTMGSQAALIAEFSARPELRSWRARQPALVYAVVPFIVFISVILAITAVTVFSVQYLQEFTRGPVMWEASVQAFLKSCSVGVPLALAIGVSIFAIRQRSSWFWPAIGITVIALFGGSFDVFVGWENQAIAWVTVNSTFVWPFPENFAATMVRATLTLVTVLVPYIYISRTLAIPCREDAALLQCTDGSSVL